MLRSASTRPIWLDCQRSAVLLPHFRSFLTAKDLKFRFHSSALPWLPKTWCSASALRSALTAKDLKFRFRSVFTAKDLKFHVRTFVLHWLPKMWSSASALPWLPNMWNSVSAPPLCFDWQRSEVPLSALVLPGVPKRWSSASAFHLCPDFQRFAVSLLHFRSILTAKDLKIGFSTNTLPSLSNMGSSASALPFCLDCKRICSFTFQICLHSPRCERTSALPLLPKFCLLSSAVGSYYVFPHNFVLSYMKD